MPRKKTIEQTLYRFDELSPTAQDRAKQDYAAIWGYDRDDEAFASLKAFAEHFHAPLQNWEIDYFQCSYSSAQFRLPDEDPTREELAALLAELGSYNSTTLRGEGDCVLTGYFTDEDCIDGFRIALMRDNETDLRKLMEAGFREWLKSVQSDCEWLYENEQFGETCDANNWEFTEEGERV